MPREKKERSGNGNPYQARISKARKRLQKIDPAELREVRQALTLGMVDLVDSLESTNSIEEKCRLVNAIARGSSALTAIFTACEFEQRIAVIEEKQRTQPGQFGATA